MRMGPTYYGEPWVNLSSDHPVTGSPRPAYYNHSHWVTPAEGHGGRGVLRSEILVPMVLNIEVMKPRDVWMDCIVTSVLFSLFREGTETLIQ